MEVIKERRRDIGLKLLYVIGGAVITLMLWAFLQKTFEKADYALALGNENKKDIAVIQETVKGINKNFDTVNGKLDLLLGWKK